MVKPKPYNREERWRKTAWKVLYLSNSKEQTGNVVIAQNRCARAAVSRQFK
jgi:hypothetical protein